MLHLMRVAQKVLAKLARHDEELAFDADRQSIRFRNRLDLDAVLAACQPALDFRSARSLGSVSDRGRLVRKADDADRDRPGRFRPAADNRDGDRRLLVDPVFGSQNGAQD